MKYKILFLCSTLQINEKMSKLTNKKPYNISPNMTSWCLNQSAQDVTVLPMLFDWPLMLYSDSCTLVTYQVIFLYFYKKKSQIFSKEDGGIRTAGKQYYLPVILHIKFRYTSQLLYGIYYKMILVVSFI